MWVRIGRSKEDHYNLIVCPCVWRNKKEPHCLLRFSVKSPDFPAIPSISIVKVRLELGKFFVPVVPGNVFGGGKQVLVSLAA